MALAARGRLLLMMSTVFGICRGFPSGAPTSSCQSMMPDHEATPQDHSKRSSPFGIHLENDIVSYEPNQVIEVKIYSPDSEELVRGFLLEVRTLSGDPPGPVGKFLEPAKGTKTICTDSALTHRTWRSKDKFKGTWQAPAQDVGEVVFVATVLLDYDTFWVNVRSPVLTPIAPTPAPHVQPLLLAGNTTDLVCQTQALRPLPAERPHVAILCSEHAHCPCGWVCCPSCAGNVCDGVAICRQPSPTSTSGTRPHTYL